MFEKTIGLCSLVMITLVFTGTTSAQVVPDEGEVLLAALAHTRQVLEADQHVKGPVKLEPRIFGADWPMRDEVLTRWLASRLGAAVETVDAVRVCPSANDRSSCHLKEAAALLAAGEPRIDERRATVIVRSWFEVPWTGADPAPPVFQAVAELDALVTLEFRDGRWRVVSFDVKRIT